MNVLIVSECSKNALNETRRILDQFAERCGRRTWQTHITQQGLETLRKLLKSSARRNTAVVCHWIRSKDHTELLWIVGNPKFFNERGRIPTNTTERDILRQHDENDWHTLQDIQILAAIAALFHDFGKASVTFQKKLDPKSGQKLQADVYRHEWVSLRLFQAFVAGAFDDNTWLNRLSKLDQDNNGITQKNCLEILARDGLDISSADSPFEKLPLLAKIVGWLILTHHFLPQFQNKEEFSVKKLNKFFENMEAKYNGARVNINEGKKDKPYEKNKRECWQFESLPFCSKSWCERASYWGEQALKRTQLSCTDWLNDFYSLHLARLSLMLADHHYSSLPTHNNVGDLNFPLYANTDADGKRKQRLDEHLIGVAKHTNRIVKILPLLEKILPRIARHKGFKRRSSESRFQWQNQAYDLASQLREHTEKQGFFGVNMASTGCGKTLANGRIMYALAASEKGARFCIALGLRTLTLQTGKAYRERLGLKEDDLAILVGSMAVKDLFDLAQKNNEKSLNDEKIIKPYGSESAEPLMPQDNTYVHYEGPLVDGSFKQWLDKNAKASKLLSAPILVCTIDYLIGATEGTRGGKQIIPMLRLLTSDLVLDEPDEFDMDDLPALSRLVHWAGMLGSRVLLSSATLPPALVTGLFNAYKAGREMFQKSRGIRGKAVNICCAWFDEYSAKSSEHADEKGYMAAHNSFVEKRIKKLREAEIRRKIIIKPLEIKPQEKIEIRQQVAETIHKLIYELHEKHHTVDKITKKKVSFGLVRLANINPLIDIAEHLFKQDAQGNHRIKLCCYHSRFPLLLRTSIETQLDRFLDRRNEKTFFDKKELRKIIDNCTEDNVIFVVLASPIAEIGRDHDYDWAIVEPSSIRSIIQLAGRVKRHRVGECLIPNIYLLNTNIRSLEQQNGMAAYCWPGFEKKGKNGHYLLNSHDLNELLSSHEYENINAAPRIQYREKLVPKENLVDLEHARLHALMLGQQDEENIPASLWWNTQAMLSSFLQQKTRFRNSRKQERFVLLWEEKDERLKFFNIETGIPIPCDHRFFHSDEKTIQMGKGIEPWGNANYMDLLNTIIERSDLSGIMNYEKNLRDFGLRYGGVDLPIEDNKESEWCYNPILGLRRKER